MFILVYVTIDILVLLLIRKDIKIVTITNSMYPELCYLIIFSVIIFYPFYIIHGVYKRW